MKIERYGFLDARNVEVGGMLDRIEPARETARANGWKLIAYTFVFEYSELVHDYSRDCPKCGGSMHNCKEYPGCLHCDDDECGGNKLI